LAAINTSLCPSLNVEWRLVCLAALFVASPVKKSIWLLRREDAGLVKGVIPGISKMIPEVGNLIL